MHETNLREKKIMKTSGIPPTGKLPICFDQTLTLNQRRGGLMNTPSSLIYH
jgi:hypothetical protein